jgi:sec-independent protein translocase protein TatA
MVGDIFQPTHLLFVLVIALLVLGPKKLPEVGRQLGNGLRDFRAAINGEHTEHEEVQARHEQAVTDTPADHEFAHEPTAETTPDEHEFAHEPAAEAPSNGHEFAHETKTGTGDDTPEPGEAPVSGHEFAYETSESPDKRTDPLA